MPYTHSLVCWRTEPPPWGVSRKGRPPPDDQDLLPRRNTYLCLCKKPRLRGLGTSFFIRFDLVLILSMPKNLKWLVQDLLPQEKTRTTGSAGTGSFGSFARSWIHRLDVCCVGICFSGLFIFRLAFRPGLRLQVGRIEKEWSVVRTISFSIGPLSFCLICASILGLW